MRIVTGKRIWIRMPQPREAFASSAEPDTPAGSRGRREKNHSSIHNVPMASHYAKINPPLLEVRTNRHNAKAPKRGRLVSYQAQGHCPSCLRAGIATVLPSPSKAQAKTHDDADIQQHIHYSLDDACIEPQTQQKRAIAYTYRCLEESSRVWIENQPQS